MSDKDELIELCKIAIHLGGPQNLSAVGIGRYLRLCNPDLVLMLVREVEKLASERDLLRKALTNVNEAVQREYWNEYAGLDDTRAILKQAGVLGKDEATALQDRDNSAFMEGDWATDPRGRLVEQ